MLHRHRIQIQHRQQYRRQRRRYPETPDPTPVSTPEKRADTVTIGIDCHMALANYDKLDSALKDERFVPSSGVILADTQVELTGGESVYDVLQKAWQSK